MLLYLTFDLTYEKKGGDNVTINHSKERASVPVSLQTVTISGI
jgi:hypothetical protein